MLLKSIKIILITLFIFKTSPLMGQNIASYKWENRLLFIITDDSESPIYINQINELRRCNKDFTERKLLIYQIKKESYKIGLRNDTKWKKSSKLYKNYKKTTAPFEILLIGLDGGIKLQQTSLLKCKSLFETIDVMPMRQSELNNN